ILIGKYRVRLEGIEALLVRQISKAGIASGEAAGVEDSLEKISGVEIQRAASRGRRAGDGDHLRGLRAVGYVGVEGQCQQGMVVEDAIRSTHYRFATRGRVPSDADARRHIVVVTRNALTDAQRILRRLGRLINGVEGRRQLKVI